MKVDVQVCGDERVGDEFCTLLICLGEWPLLLTSEDRVPAATGCIEDPVPKVW